MKGLFNTLSGLNPEVENRWFKAREGMQESTVCLSICSSSSALTPGHSFPPGEPSSCGLMGLMWAQVGSGGLMWARGPHVGSCGLRRAQVGSGGLVWACLHLLPLRPEQCSIHST